MSAVDTPWHKTRPAVGRSSPAIRLSRVVLPLPDLPIMAWTIPGSNSWVTPLRASTLWYWVS